jgi:hypothetical protein
MSRRSKIWAAGLGAGLTAVWLCSGTGTVQAHRPVTSSYTYHDHIQPLFRFYCGGCHLAGGIAPMSLVSYREAYPWAESVKEHLLAESMHPWHDDEGFGLFTPGQRMTPRELDMIVDWAGGGTPEGAPQPDTAAVAAAAGWALGEPDLVVPLPAPVTLAAVEEEKTVTVALPVRLPEDCWFAGMDLKPGQPGIVHDAVLYLAPDGAREAPASMADLPARQILAAWIPGQPRALADRNAAHRIPADARLMVRLHYRKTWRDEGKVMTDRSVLGLYVTALPPRRTMQTLVLRPARDRDAAPKTAAVEQTLARDMAVTGIMPGLSAEGASVQISAVQPDGREIRLLRVARYDPGWPVRYDFPRPVALPRGSRLKVTGRYAALRPSGSGRHGLTVWMDYYLP